MPIESPLPTWSSSGGTRPGSSLRGSSSSTITPLTTTFAGIGEPIWPGRSPAELVECRLHESLLNVAFDGGPTLTLLCPYDVEGLEPDVIEGARHTHPMVGPLGDDQPSESYDSGRDATCIFTEALPRPSGQPDELRFSRGPLHELRRFVVARATAAGLTQSRAEDMVLAANEIASNSLLHGGGTGTVRVWTDERFVRLRDS